MLFFARKTKMRMRTLPKKFRPHVHTYIPRYKIVRNRYS